MADFRKWLPVLAVLALLVAAQANAQPLCTASAIPTTVRAEGLTELVGDASLNCSGVTPGGTYTTNLQVFLNAPFTSRILDSASGRTEALLTSPDAALTPAVPALTVLGIRVQDNAVAWPGVTITPTGTTFVLRMTNIRVNAQAVGASGTAFPSQIFALISASALSITSSPQQIVAFVNTGMTFNTRRCDGTDNSGTTSYNQCTSASSGLAGNPASTSTSNLISYNVVYSEGYANAFKTRTEERGVDTSAILAAPSNAADSGTRLLARFVNIPTGVQIFVVTGSNARSSGAINPGTSATIGATLVSTTDQTGSSATIVGTGGIIGTGSAFCSQVGTASADAFRVSQVPLASGAGAATWEITADNPNAIETATFGVVVAFAASPSTNSPAVGTGQVLGNLAPISAVISANATAPIPRFADITTNSRTAVSISICVTNLLFPYVTNQNGFDTGIVISNTSDDAGTSPDTGAGSQSGVCTINYYGGTTGGGAAPAAQKSAAVDAGQQLIFTVGLGGNLGITGTAGFQGYLITQCQFQFAHGFAFITNGTTAMGYLALVLPSTDERSDQLSVGRETLGL
jgi:hypothetical protein